MSESSKKISQTIVKFNWCRGYMEIVPTIIDDNSMIEMYIGWGIVQYIWWVMVRISARMPTKMNEW